MTDDWFSIENKYVGKCYTCGNMIEVGVRVLWKKDSGIRHDPNCEEIEQLQEDNSIPIIIIDQDD